MATYAVHVTRIGVVTLRPGNSNIKLVHVYTENGLFLTAQSLADLFTHCPGHQLNQSLTRSPSVIYPLSLNHSTT
jgi:hypothetical protein